MLITRFLFDLDPRITFSFVVRLGPLTWNEPSGIWTLSVPILIQCLTICIFIINLDQIQNIYFVYSLLTLDK